MRKPVDSDNRNFLLSSIHLHLTYTWARIETVLDAQMYKLAIAIE